MSRSTDESRWGDQRRMRAKAKVAIRRRDRRKLERISVEDMVSIEPVCKRSKASAIK